MLQFAEIRLEEYNKRNSRKKNRREKGRKFLTHLFSSLKSLFSPDTWQFSTRPRGVILVNNEEKVKIVSQRRRFHATLERITT